MEKQYGIALLLEAGHCTGLKAEAKMLRDLEGRFCKQLTGMSIKF